METAYCRSREIKGSSVSSEVSFDTYEYTDGVREGVGKLNPASGGKLMAI